VQTTKRMTTCLFAVIVFLKSSKLILGMGHFACTNPSDTLSAHPTFPSTHTPQSMPAVDASKYDVHVTQT